MTAEPAHRPAAAGAPSPWEQAYLRFETPAQEQRKFTARLRAAGADRWDRDAVILDLFSGRGGCAIALQRMGFRQVISLDLSSTLLRARGDSTGSALADCRALPIASRSVDVATVHGGLHHLLHLPDDLSSTLGEVARVLRREGLLLAVEPWRTPFLDAVHWICRSRMARRAYGRLDALATMIELERATYESWLDQDREILATFERYFAPRQSRIRLGKLHYLGSPRSA